MVDEVGSGRITAGIEEKTLAEETVAFVYRQLPKWRDDPDRADEQAEVQLNLQLCKFLEVHARNEYPMVCFYHEEPQSGQRKVDLSATPSEPMVIDARQYTIYTPFLVLEGKRLPAPTADREKEYVTGIERNSGSPTGGIQRFKLGLHGANLNTAVMLGYVQDRLPPDWHRVINVWISDLVTGVSQDICTWQQTEVLGPLNEDVANQVSVCISKHDRSGNTLSNAIQLHHLWVVMN